MSHQWPARMTHNSIGCLLAIAFLLLALRPAAGQTINLPRERPDTIDAALADRDVPCIVVVAPYADRANRGAIYGAWNDAKVQEWIGKHARAFQYHYGGEDETDRPVNQLHGLPIGLTVFKRGEVLDQEEHFRSGEDLLEWLGHIDAGAIPAEFATRRAGTRADDSLLVPRAVYALRLDRLGRKKDADTELAWVLEQYYQRLETMADTRDKSPAAQACRTDHRRVLAYGFVERTLTHVRTEPELLARFVAIRDRYGRIADESPSMEAIEHYLMASEVAPQPDWLIAWHKRVVAHHVDKVDPDEAHGVVFRELIRLGRWADAGRVWPDPVGVVRDVVASTDTVELNPNLKAMTPESRARYEEEKKERRRQKEHTAAFFSSLVYASLLAGDQEDVADKVAKLALSQLLAPDAFRCFVTSSLQAGQVREHHRTWAEMAGGVIKLDPSLEPLVPRVVAALADRAKK